MPQTINTNILSLTAQRNLNRSQGDLAIAMQRLSSGLRINSAKDDAAGLAISERFTTQIRGLNQAVRNANDGISLAQTGEGALGELTQNLQRIRELAVQSANATNSDSDRSALNLEVKQRLEEIDRIASQTTFNGRKMLDGSFGNMTFQVGPDAGQTIGLDLPGSARLRDIGQIATAKTVGLGSNATGGSVGLANISNFNFLNPVDPTKQYTTDGGVTLTAGTYLFGTNTDPGDTGDIAIANVASTTNFADTGVTYNGIAVLSTTDFDYAGMGNLAQFDVTIGGSTVGITLTANYVSAANMALQIDAQLDVALGAGNWVNNDAAGNIIFTNNSNAAVTVTNFDANANAAGFPTSYLSLAGNSVDNETRCTADGHLVTLNANYVDNNGVASEIQSDLNASAGAGAYTVSWDAGNNTYDIINNTIGSNAPAVVANNASAYLLGWDKATNITADNGHLATTSNEAKFVVDGTYTVTLTDNFNNYEDLRTAIDAVLPDITYQVSLTSGNQIRIVNISNTPAPVVITATGVDLPADAIANSTGFGPISGAFSNNASFDVDGRTVTLSTSLGNLAGMVDELNNQVNGWGYTVEAYDSNNDSVDDGIRIINDTMGSAPVQITNANSKAVAAGIVNATGVAGTASGSITLSNFTIALDGGDPVSISGTFANAKALADAINREISGVVAEAINGEVKLSSTQKITLGGTDATNVMNFANVEIEPTSGNMIGMNILTVEAANATMVRVDSALTTVSSLRSTFGAIQNRFESVITNLSTSAENLTASRSRIMDADFAAETAALSRAQILQQAGTAMVAQANQIPQGVLALLRGG